MVNIKYYLVSVDRCDHRVISDLEEEDLKDIICYAVNETVQPKLIYPKFNIIKEWELEWYNYRYQYLQYYEYGLFVHALKNPKLIENLSHIGLLHYDVKFKKNSVKEIYQNLEENPNIIFYNTWRQNNTLYFSYNQLEEICKFMSERLDISIDPKYIWKNGWVSEALSITPIEVFKKFGNFIINHQYEIESILNNNRWGIMDLIKHRICGFIERLWGIYLVSYGLELKQMPIIHEHSLYYHLHFKFI